MTASRSRASLTAWSHLKEWRTELLFAAPIVIFASYLFYTWYGVLDRYQIFLYYHGMGAGFDTTPFGHTTAGRYWVASLVCAGAVMLPYLAINFALGRAVKSYRPPVGWRLWTLCAVPLAIIVPIIVMTVNAPVLPFGHALRVIVALLAGLALAIAPGSYVARHPMRYPLLMIDGFTLAGLLGALTLVERLAGWAERGSGAYVVAFLVLVALAIGVLLVMTLVYWRWRRAEIPGVGTLLLAAFDVIYLFMPLVHYLLMSNSNGGPTRYISDANNFFATNILIQLGAWIAVALLVAGMTRLRRWTRRGAG